MYRYEYSYDLHTRGADEARYLAVSASRTRQRTLHPKLHQQAGEGLGSRRVRENLGSAVRVRLYCVMCGDMETPGRYENSSMRHHRDNCLSTIHHSFLEGRLCRSLHEENRIIHNKSKL